MERNKDQIYGQDLLMHTYTWYLPSLSGYDPNDPQGPSDPNTYFTLTVRVSDRSEPLSWMVNRVTADSDQWDGAYAEECTPICGWGGEIIYTDQNAPGYVQNGTSWAYAYRDLQRALARAARGGGGQIRIADGVYRPGDHPEDTFLIPAGVSVVGGYAGYGADDPDQQDRKRYKTILSGYIGEGEYGYIQRNETVVKMADNSLLSGVIVEEGYNRGIRGVNSSFSLSNCIIRNNIERGIVCEYGNLTVRWSEIAENGQQGLYHLGNGYTVTVENCRIHDNLYDGILTDSSSSMIINSLIYQNGSGSTYSDTYYGIHLGNPGVNTEIRNNTIVHNTNEGIRRSGGYPPDVRNCILFANNVDGNYLDYNDSGITWHCCLTDPNHLDQPKNDPLADGRGNMKTHPGFAYLYPVYGYFHLNWDSPCRDKGDSDNYPNEKDMDGQDRVSGIKVDIGADEVSCEDTSHPNDWNGDGVINYEDFAILSRAWLSCDPNTYPPPKDPEDEYIWYVQRWGFQADLSQDGCVNLDDLVIFSEQTYENWLWTACWREDYWDVWGMRDGGGEGTLALGGAEEMKTMPMMIESFEATSEQSVCEVNPEMLEQNIRLVLEEIEKAIETEEEGLNLENLFEIKVFLEEVLWDLQNGED